MTMIMQDALDNQATEPLTPWVKVAAEDLKPGMRLWEPDGRHDTFLRRTSRHIGSMYLGTDMKRIVFTGGMTGRECSLAVETWRCTLKVVREDAK